MNSLIDLFFSGKVLQEMQLTDIKLLFIELNVRNEGNEKIID